MKSRHKSALVLGFLGTLLLLGGLALMVLLAPTLGDDKLLIMAVGGVLALMGIVAFISIFLVLRHSRDPQGLTPFQPQTFQGSRQVFNLATLLDQQLTDTPYHVLAGIDGVRVEWDLGDVRYRSLLQTNRVQRVHRTTLIPEGNKVISRQDVMTWDSTAGAFRVAGSGSHTAGISVNLEKRQEFTATPQRGVQKPLDYAVDTRVVSDAVNTALSRLGLKKAWPVEAKIGLVFALFPLIGALVIVPIALLA